MNARIHGILLGDSCTNMRNKFISHLKRVSYSLLLCYHCDPLTTIQFYQIP